MGLAAILQRKLKWGVVPCLLTAMDVGDGNIKLVKHLSFGTAKQNVENVVDGERYAGAT